jgi:hypothetical protein
MGREEFSLFDKITIKRCMFQIEAHEQPDSPKAGEILLPLMKADRAVVANPAKKYGAMDLSETVRML